jgi:hypothetical protein
MKRRVLLLVLFLSAALSLSGAGSQQSPSRKTWYERLLRRINPDDTDYGKIFEERKKTLMDRVGNPCSQYSFAATVTILWLLFVLFAQHLHHRRREDIAVDSIADALRHDAYSREKAREAIRRYNDHIETCNRMIEAEESGVSPWVASAEWDALQSELEQYRNDVTALREETRRLREECEKHKATVAELSLPSRDGSQPALPFAQDTRVAELVTRINELQDELIAERKKNRRSKGSSPQ